MQETGTRSTSHLTENTTPAKLLMLKSDIGAHRKSVILVRFSGPPITAIVLLLRPVHHGTHIHGGRVWKLPKTGSRWICGLSFQTTWSWLPMAYFKASTPLTKRRLNTAGKYITPSFHPLSQWPAQIMLHGRNTTTTPAVRCRSSSTAIRKNFQKCRKVLLM